MYLPDPDSARQFIIDTCNFLVQFEKYLPPSMIASARQLRLRAIWHHRHHPNTYPQHLMRQRRRICHYGRLAEAVVSIIGHLPKLDEKTRFFNGKYSVELTNVGGGFFIEGTVGPRRPDLSTTIVAALSPSTVANQGPYHNPMLLEVAKGMLVHGLTLPSTAQRSI